MSKDELADRFYALVNAANKKKPTKQQLSDLRTFLNEHPEVWQRVTTFPRVVSQTILNEQMAGQKATTMAIEAEMKGRRRELGYDMAPQLEQMLIDQILLCWLRLQLVELQYTGVLVNNYTFQRIEHYEKRVSAAQRRYLQAVQALARVRKLAQNTPALQFNIAEQQIVAVQ